MQDLEPLSQQRERLEVDSLRKMYTVVKHIFRSPTAPKYIVEREALECKPQEMTSREAILALDVFKDLGILKEEALDDGRHVYRWGECATKSWNFTHR